MKLATDNLIDDHVLIVEVMDFMDYITTIDNPDVEHLEFIVSFIREFADGHHHAKEEGLLFPKLVEKGMPKEQGPIGVMLSEHDKGRAYVKGMAENISLYKSGKNEALKAVYLNMKGYTSLLRDHIHKENNILFKMADNFLSGEEQNQLLEKFNQEETANNVQSKKEHFISRIKEFTAVYQ